MREHSLQLLYGTEEQRRQRSSPSQPERSGLRLALLVSQSAPCRSPKSRQRARPLFMR
jgi:hypothetical protein